MATYAPFVKESRMKSARGAALIFSSTKPLLSRDSALTHPRLGLEARSTLLPLETTIFLRLFRAGVERRL
jgi:hypothetical protein